MNKVELYKILQSISIELAESDNSISKLPPDPDWDVTLESLGIDAISAQDYFQKLELRIPTKKFQVRPNIIESLHLYPNLGSLCNFFLEECFERQRNPEIVYVDDEQENLFIFKRKYGKRLNIKTFEDPLSALDYISKSPNVSLVITDEVMPGMNGNQLCDEVKKSKPNLKFILITGNPNGDGDLMYLALRKNRFYEFINKPVDFENKGEEYFTMIQGLIDFDW
jgi:CheY-like chemotaxis protein